MPNSKPVLAGHVDPNTHAVELVAIVAIPDPPLVTKSKKKEESDGRLVQYPPGTVLVSVVRLRRLAGDDDPIAQEGCVRYGHWGETARVKTDKVSIQDLRLSVFVVTAGVTRHNAIACFPLIEGKTRKEG